MELGCEVVVTGWDVVCPLGIGKDSFTAALAHGTSGVRRLPWLEPSDYPIKIGSDVRDFDGREYVQPRKALKVMSREVQMGYAACMLAAADAQLARDRVDPDQLGVIFASEMFYPDAEELADTYRACLHDHKFQFADWGRKGLARIFPLWMLKYLPNMIACHVGIALDARGPNNTICNGDISSLLAVQEAYHLIRRGQADVVVVGGAGTRLNVTPLVYRDTGCLSRRNDAPQAASRPFDASRDGMVNGEGAAAIVLERRGHAEARSVPILSHVLGGASTFDARFQRDLEPAYARSLRMTLENSGLSAADVGHVNAHGLSTIASDVAEARAIRHVLGDTPVTAPKSLFGNLGAAGGMIELCASLAGLAKNCVPHTINCERLDPQCPVELIRDAPATPRSRVVLALNQNTSGATACLAVSVAGD